MEVLLCSFRGSGYLKVGRLSPGLHVVGVASDGTDVNVVLPLPLSVFRTFNEMRACHEKARDLPPLILKTGTAKGNRALCYICVIFIILSSNPITTFSAPFLSSA